MFTSCKQTIWHKPSELQPWDWRFFHPCTSELLQQSGHYIPGCTASSLLPGLPGCVTGRGAVGGYLVWAWECQPLTVSWEWRENPSSFSAKEQRCHLSPSISSWAQSYTELVPIVPHSCMSLCGLHSSLPGPHRRILIPTLLSKTQELTYFAKESHWSSRKERCKVRRARPPNTLRGKQNSCSPKEAVFWELHSKCLTSVI